MNDTPFNRESTETIVPNRQTTNNNRNDALATKLDRLHDKNERFKSHKEFLTKCMEGNVIPRGLRLELEPSIGNHDEEFLGKWYQKLEEFSKSFMKDIIEFCDKTQDETNTYIKEIDDKLKSAVHDNEYTDIKKTIDSNNNMRMRNLKQKKIKKYFSLKHARNDNNPVSLNTYNRQEQRNNKPMEESENRLTPHQGTSYANAVRNYKPQNNYLRKTNATNTTQGNTQMRSISRQTSNTNVNISDRLSLRRKNSNTNVQSSKEILLQGQINELKEKLKNLEKNNESEVHHIINQNKENDLERQKNEVPAQNINQGLNTELNDVFGFISNAIETLRRFEKRFKQHINTGRSLRHSNKSIK